MSGEEMGRDLSEQRGLAAWLPRRLAEASPSILVVGDLILDGWWSGPSDRMCREAPAPVVDINRREFSPGGAANTAMNLASLGARVSVAGLIGTDDAGTELMRQLVAAGVDTRFLAQDPEMVTTTKIRISSGGQVLLRFDDAAATIPESASAALAAGVPAAVEAPDAVVICDYGTGALDEPVRSRLIEALARRGPDQLVVVDAHDPRPWAALHPDLVTPNAQETARPLRTSSSLTRGPPCAARPSWNGTSKASLIPP